MKDETIGAMIFIIILLFIFSIPILSMLEYINNSKECDRLGFDEIDSDFNINPKCMKIMDYNKEEGKYNKCYMPIIKNITAEEWCRE